MVEPQQLASTMMEPQQLASSDAAVTMTTMMEPQQLASCDCAVDQVELQRLLDIYLASSAAVDQVEMQGKWQVKGFAFLICRLERQTQRRRDRFLHKMLCRHH